MDTIQVITGLTALVILLANLADFIVKLTKGRSIFFNRTMFYVVLCIGLLALGLFLGNYYGSKARPPITSLQDNHEQTSRLEGQVAAQQNQISAFARTIDYLKGITGRLNERIDEDNRKLGIPQRVQIILFEHINYKGHRCYLSIEDDASDLGLYGFTNSVSSIKLEGGARARLYSGRDYSGSSWLVESDMPSVDINWNDKALSVSVEQTNNTR